MITLLMSAKISFVCLTTMKVFFSRQPTNGSVDSNWSIEGNVYKSVSSGYVVLAFSLLVTAVLFKIE